MVDARKTPPGPPLLKNFATAPIISLDDAPTYGHFNGMIAVEVCAHAVNQTGPATTTVERVCTAHLRGTPAAMRALVSAIEGALRLSEQQDQPVKLAS